MRERESALFFNEFSDLCFCESYCSKISDRNFQYAQNGVHLNYYYLSSFQWFSDTVFVTLLKKKAHHPPNTFPKTVPTLHCMPPVPSLHVAEKKKNC